jgi:uncharacterized lipoprotein YddW (UPF0748 family)
VFYKLKTKLYQIAVALSPILITSCCVTNNTTLQAANNISEPPREFRAVWVATVDNIDWPSKPGLTTEQQKNEAIAILDKAKQLNLNAVIFQVRPHTDAMYSSKIEPWSYYLTGKEGKAPKPYYDPLQFWITEAHKRGLELHAWFNPYRAKHPAMKSASASNSIIKTHPELVLKLGSNGYYWMDPSLKATQDWTTNVIMDVVKRYDIDGVHFDDYFYPYWDYNDGKDFPDSKSWNEYKKSGGKLSRNDWRRNSVNKLVKRVYENIKKEKPYVKFGISPFGIWRPGHPATIEGFDQYDKLYADAKLWLNKGWVDYYTPQLYWPISKIPQSYPVLLSWWNKENTMNRHLWPGLYLTRATQKPGGDKEMINQIMVTRGIVSNGPGNVFFSMKAFINDYGKIDEALTNEKGPYSKQALIPSYPWLNKELPNKPAVTTKDNMITITGNKNAHLCVIYFEQNDEWSYKIVPFINGIFTLNTDIKTFEEIAVSVVDRYGNESEKVFL